MLNQILQQLQWLLILAERQDWLALEKDYPQWSSKVLAFVGSSEMTQMPYERQANLLGQLMRANQVLSEQTRKTQGDLSKQMVQLNKEYKSAKAYLG
jgi:hypothetical protein